MNELHYHSIADLGRLLEAREISSVEITQAQLDRISILDAELKAFALVTADEALEQARLADQDIARGIYRGAMHGVPIAVKDLFYMRGVPTRGGAAVLEHFIPAFDSTVVTKLRNAGAVILGKLNLAEGAMAAYNPKFAAPYNPWKRSISPGGSSSGSGVATAAGMCFGSLGTDTGGSIRFPSSMCGVVGVKPTWGRVSRYGVLDLAPSMDHVGPLTRTVGDAAIMLDIISGYDNNDLTSINSKSLSIASGSDTGVADIRIGYAEQYASLGVDEGTVAAVVSSVDTLRSLGAKIIDVAIPVLDEYLIAWRVLCACEAYISHRRFFPSRAVEYGPWFRSWLEYGAGCSGADYARAHLQRIECNAVIARAFADVDVLLCPAMVAPERRKSYAQNFVEPMGQFSAKRQRFTIPYNLNGAPTITIPAGLNADGDPVSVQCVGKPGCEGSIFKVARAVERSLQGVVRHPPL